MGLTVTFYSSIQAIPSGCTVIEKNKGSLAALEAFPALSVY
jgi:hypothetical protein